MHNQLVSERVKRLSSLVAYCSGVAATLLRIQGGTKESAAMPDFS